MADHHGGNRPEEGCGLMLVTLAFVVILAVAGIVVWILAGAPV